MEGCPYCVKTTPFWNQLSSKYKNTKFEKIERNQIVGKNISGFPQFHIIEDGKTRIVEGSQDSLPQLEAALGLGKMDGGRNRTRRLRRTVRKRRATRSRYVGL